MADQDFTKAPTIYAREKGASHHGWAESPRSGCEHQASYTPEEFAAAMRALRDHSESRFDTSANHHHMDMLMAHVLETLGYGEGVAVFLEEGRWYA